jgi:hypothetical protein
VGLRELHENFAWFVVLSNAAVGAWALAANWLEGLRHRALWWCTVVAQVSLFVQAGLGVGIITSEDIEEAPQLHLLYGFTALATVGIIYSYRQQLAERRYLLYGLGGLFLMGLAIRAMTLTR